MKINLGRFNRLSRLIWGALCLMWLPVEDQKIFLVLSLGILFGGLTLGALVDRPERQNPFWIGIQTGFAIPMVTLLLMLLKGGLHGHGFPDFQVSQFVTLIKLIPVLTMLGGLIGFVVILIQSRMETMGNK